MKLLRTVNDTKVYDCNVKDYFGNKVEIWHNEALNEYRLMSKNENYNQNRKQLDSIGCKNVIVQRYGEIIDITYDTFKKLSNLFDGVKHTQFQLWT